MRLNEMKLSDLQHQVWARFAELAGDARGNAILEFAFVAMLLSVLGVGMFDMGRYAMAHNRAYGAARAGVQFGTLDQGTSGNLAGMVALAQEDADVDPQSPGHFTAVADNYCLCPGETTREADCAGSCTGGAYKPRYVEVIVTDAVDTLFDYPGLPDVLGVSAAARMRVR